MSKSSPGDNTNGNNRIDRIALGYCSDKHHKYGDEQKEKEVMVNIPAFPTSFIFHAHLYHRMGAPGKGAFNKYRKVVYRHL